MNTNQVHSPILVYHVDFLVGHELKDERIFVHFAGEDVKDPPSELCVQMTSLEEGEKLLTLIEQRAQDLQHQARVEEHAKLHAEAM